MSSAGSYSLGIHEITAGTQHLAIGGDFSKAGGVFQQGFAQFADSG